MFRKTLPYTLVALTALGGIACSDLGPETERGYAFFVETFTDDTSGNELGAAHTIDMLVCDTTTVPPTESIQGDSGVVKFNITIDEEVEFFTNLIVTLVAMRVQYRPLESVDPNDPSALMPLDTVNIVFDEGAGQTFVVGTDGEETFDYSVPIMSRGTKQEYVAKVSEFFGDSPNDPQRPVQRSTGAGLFASPRYAIKHTFWVEDNFGNGVSTSTTVVAELTDLSPCP